MQNQRQLVRSILVLSIVGSQLLFFQNCSEQGLQSISSSGESESAAAVIGDVFERNSALTTISHSVPKIDQVRSDLEKLLKLGDQVPKLIELLDQVLVVSEKLSIRVSPQTRTQIDELKSDLIGFQGSVGSLSKLLQGKEKKLLSKTKEISELLLQFNDLKKKAEEIQDRPKKTIRYAEAIIKNWGKSASSSVEDVLNCEKAGEESDFRIDDQAYFCNEIPVGETEFGLSYQKYLRDWKNFNNSLLPPIIQKSNRYSVGFMEDDFNLEIDHKFDFEEFKIKFKDHWLSWKNKKVYANVPVKYKDDQGYRVVNLVVSGDRRLNDEFRVYNFKSFANGNVAYVSGCMDLPGVNIDKNTVEAKYTVKAMLLQHTFKFRITNPDLSFQHLKTCSLFKFDLSDIKKPQVNLLYMSLPEAEDLKLGQLKIEGKDWLSKFVGTVVGAFTGSIGGLEWLADSMSGGMISNAVKDVKSGEWIYLLMQAEMIRSVKSMVTQDVESQFVQIRNEVPDEKVIFDSDDVLGSLGKFIEKYQDQLPEEI